MYEKTKISTIKLSMRPSKPWPKNLSEFNRYATFKTGAIILLALMDHPKGIKMAELLKLTGKKEKTIRRMIIVWEELGIPIYSDWNGEHELVYNTTHLWGEKFKQKLFK